MLDWYTGRFDEAIEHLTKAVMLNPTSAILYATRGNFLLLVHSPFSAECG